jgi:hypothetical protein
MNIKNKQDIIKLRKIHPKHYSKLLKTNNPNLFKQIELYNKKINCVNVSNSQKIYNWCYDIKKIPICPITYRPVNFITNEWKYRKYAQRGVFAQESLKKRSITRKQHKSSYKIHEIIKTSKIIKPSYSQILEMVEYLKIIDNQCNKNYGGMISKLCKHKKKYISYIKYMQQQNQFQLCQIIYNLVHNIQTIPICPYTNKPLKFTSYRQGYRKFNPTPESILKYKQNNRDLKIKHGENLSGRELKYAVKNIIKKEYKTHKQNLYQCFLKQYPNLIKPIMYRTNYLDKNAKFTERVFHIDNDMFEKVYTAHKNEAIFTTFENGYRLCDCSSKPELEIKNFIQSIYNDDILYNDRNIIHPYELDVYIPEKNIGIEINGEFWHSDKYKSKLYHKQKFDLCKSKNIQLLQIMAETEWNQKQNIVKSIIKAKLNIFAKKIYARECQIKQVPKKDGNIFFNENHIQGDCKSGVYLGLFYKDNLVSLMSFGKRRITKTKIDNIELLRFSSKLNTQVIGGASKLFKHYIKNYNPEKITTYADLRFTKDPYFYEKLGFTLKNISAPNYWYFKNNQSTITKLYHRSGFMKHKLKNILQNFDPDKTEQDNMKMNKWNRIWDCGNYVFEWSSK